MEVREIAARISSESTGAYDRIRPYLATTPLVRSGTLSRECGSEVSLKCEHRQTTGSFKLRGALNKILSLAREQLDEGVVVASTGNHGAAVAHACRLLGGKCTVVVPNDVRSAKEQVLRALGAEVVKHGADGLESELYARALSVRRGLEYISPYNDLDVIIGQATVALDLLDQLTPSASIYIAVGGGGLISGMSSVLKEAHSEIRIVGCSPANHPVMDESVKAGHIVDLPYQSTLSDGTAGRLEPDTITLPLCSLLVDDWIQASEEEIVDSLRHLARQEHMIVEGAAAVAVAALRKDAVRRSERVAILCGGNIDRDVLANVLTSDR